MVPWNNVGEQSNPNTKRTLVHVGPTMGGALTPHVQQSAIMKVPQRTTRPWRNSRARQPNSHTQPCTNPVRLPMC